MAQSSSSAGQGSKDVQACHTVQMCYMVSGTAGNCEVVYDIAMNSEPKETLLEHETSGRKAMLAITDTACTKAVAGHAWFESYCNVADNMGWEVELVEEADKFRFGASRVHESHFSVWAQFAVGKQPFKAKIAIVQCDVPLLFSRAVLGKLGMTYHIDGQCADLKAFGLFGVGLKVSPTGHPAFDVSDFPNDTSYVSGTWSVDSEVCLPILDAEAHRAYMARAAVEGSSSMSSHFKHLFFPKKISIEIENVLKAETLSKVSFFTWWKTANQSRDFWIETEDSLIRVHVVPRKHPFDPCAWKTTNSPLREDLMLQLGDVRTTEAIPCHSEGLQLFHHVGAWRQGEVQHQESENFEITGFEQLWIGRSCFARRQSSDKAPSTDASSIFVAAELTMEDAPRRACGRAGELPSGCAPTLDSARSPTDGGGAKSNQIPEGSLRPMCRPDEDEAGGANYQGQGVQCGVAGETNSRGPDQADQGPSTTAGATCHDLRQVPQLAVSRDTRGLHELGCARSAGQPELRGRPEDVCHLGKDGAGTTPGKSQEGWHHRGSGRPGGESGGGAARCVSDELEVFHLVSSPKQQEVGTRAREEALAGRAGVGRGPCDDARTHRGREERAAGAGDESGIDSSEVSAAASWTGSVIKNVKAWWSGERSHGRSDASETESEETPVNSAEIGHSSEAKYNILPEEGATIGLGSEAKYNILHEEGATVGLGSEVNYKADVKNVMVLEVEHESDCDLGEGQHGGMIPRQKAVEGMRRRRLEKKPLRRKLKAMTKKVQQVLIASAFVVASMANELVVEPGMDLMECFAPQLLHGKCEPPALLEVFAGSAVLSNTFAQGRRGVVRPVDIIYGDNLRDAETRQQLYETIDKEKPRLVWVAPPCTEWCGFSRLNHTKQERRRRRKKEKVFLEMINEIMILQLGGRRDVIVENPMTSDIWRDPLLARWCEDPSMSFFRTDLCQFGLRSIDGKELLRKPLKLLASNPIYEKVLAVKCDDQREHKVVQGQETSHSAGYPLDFAKAVMRAEMEVRKIGINEILTAENEEDEIEKILNSLGDDPIPSGAGDISFRGAVSAPVAGALKRLHQNLGHPPMRELVRHLRLGGASHDMIEGAEKLVCKTCAQCSQPKPHKVAKPAALLDFNEAVAIDILFFDTMESTGKMGLNMVDLASTY